MAQLIAWFIVWDLNSERTSELTLCKLCVFRPGRNLFGESRPLNGVK